MLALLLALTAQIDPNAIYQTMEPAKKHRVFLVYLDAVKSNSTIEAALEATARSMNLPLGAVRLVVIEMKRQAKIDEDAKAREQAKKASSPTAPSTRSRRAPPSSRPQRQTKTPAKVKPQPTGDGLRTEGNREEVHLGGERYSPFGFRQRCFLIRPDDIHSVNEKIPIAVDGRVKQKMKEATVLALTTENGEEESVVIVHARSTKECSSLKKDGLVRAYGWTVKEHLPQEDEAAVTADGVLFYAMDVDTDAKDFPGLSLAARVSQNDASSSQRPTWNVEVDASNDGDTTLSDLVLEVNVIAMAGKSKPANAKDTAFFFVRRLAKGETASLDVDFTSWVDKPDNTAKKTTVVEEEPAVYALVRALGGKSTAE